METLSVKASDGSDIAVRSWLPENRESVSAVVQIAHGMAEHSLRYNWFAEKLNEAGFAVYAGDHRGHGETAGSEEKLGHFADESGWDLVVSDMKSLTDMAVERHGDTPVFLFGHSMGSFLSRDYIALHGSGLKGAILSGTAGDPGVLGRMGLILARGLVMLNGGGKPSPLMDKLSFGSYNKAFSPVRTPFDWLSSINDQVDLYIKDPLCGFVCTSKFYTDLIGGLIKINSMDHIEKTPKSLPVFLFAGANDPVGNFGKGVEKTRDAFRDAGIADLTMNLYEGGRHEMLNEVNREEVASDVVSWIKARI
jgi:alpha-beta hydrolase superfamily lysophospholipase